MADGAGSRPRPLPEVGIRQRRDQVLWGRAFSGLEHGIEQAQQSGGPDVFAKMQDDLLAA